jgi:acyl-CoA synthetase (AMP-forming)/AMP-acid ligase II
MQDYICTFQAWGYTGTNDYCPNFGLRAKQYKVPLNPAFNAPQVLAALNHLAASHLIIGAETNLPRKQPRSNIPLLTHLVPNLEGSSLESELVPSLRKIIIVNNSAGRIDTHEYKSTTLYENVIEEGRDALALPDQGLDPHDIVNIQFTSGTTSMPKAACLSHRSILNNGKSIGDRMLLKETDIVCSPPPLFQYLAHVTPVSNTLLTVS